jgi:hypothetical protein
MPIFAALLAGWLGCKGEATITHRPADAAVPAHDAALDLEVGRCADSPVTDSITLHACITGQDALGFLMSARASLVIAGDAGASREIDIGSVVQGVKQWRSVEVLGVLKLGPGRDAVVVKQSCQDFENDSLSTDTILIVDPSIAEDSIVWRTSDNSLDVSVIDGSRVVGSREHVTITTRDPPADYVPKPTDELVDGKLVKRKVVRSSVVVIVRNGSVVAER